MDLIKSVGYSDTEILTNMCKLYLDSDEFDLDPTYSKGVFYREVSEPRLKFDLTPQAAGVAQADCTRLPLTSNSVRSIVFDPPFMFGTHGQTKNNKMNKRFTMFDTFEELECMYCGALFEFARILDYNGFLFFKCQDYTDSRTTITHSLVYNWATELGYYAKDLYILVATGGRIYNPNLRQRHARKFHSYWWVFQNKRKG